MVSEDAPVSSNFTSCCNVEASKQIGSLVTGVLRQQVDLVENFVILQTQASIAAAPDSDNADWASDLADAIKCIDGFNTIVGGVDQLDRF
jgi:hypothetical protein